jgi:hypothetical protein
MAPKLPNNPVTTDHQPQHTKLMQGDPHQRYTTQAGSDYTADERGFIYDVPVTDLASMTGMGCIAVPEYARKEIDDAHREKLAAQQLEKEQDAYAVSGDPVDVLPVEEDVLEDDVK